jgi:mannose-6-phosphate isomerase-like protein (cupin superfamily)
VAAHVVAEGDIEPRTLEGDTAEIRVTVDATSGSEVLEQRVVRFAPGRSQPQPLDGQNGLLYVVSGTGTLIVAGRSYELEPEMAAFVVQRSFEVENPGPGELLVVLVTAPATNGSRADPDNRTVRYEDREPLPAGKDREFRYLVDRDLGCHDATQFIGLIPPGKAPMHSHVYDEVVYILEGEGRLHVHGQAHPIETGSCMHLPPFVEHTLENTGDSPMRVLGVFHPAGDPASRAYEANE